ncbi:hypothetical protein OSB04_028648 [Centaurea solstitialis]|uniref:Integrase zinc-binding domain-containing protein n=1 Tax=Centaurea solstitialis TaxID=347529 RepID=A0AA38SZQ5_9ASTR|nr:hypothetical protein OSB04_028648 [Centaurea solstitialis]
MVPKGLLRDLAHQDEEKKDRLRTPEDVQLGYPRTSKNPTSFIKVTAMRPYKHGHQLFLEYDVCMYGTGVPRGVLQDWTFTEADLDRVHLEDLLMLIKYLQGPILRPQHYRDGTEILKKYVRHAITLARVTDYQLAIESRQPKVNLLRPNLLVPGIDAYLPYMPTRIPEHGVLYLTRKKRERKFMRFGELAKFCDGTLLYVYNGMQSRLLADQIPGRKIIDGKGKILEGMNLIERKLKERLMYRRVEAAMQMRARIIGHWEEFLQMSKDKCPDEDLNMIKTLGEDPIPWYADFANYLAAGVLVKGITHQQKGKSKTYFWFKPHLFRIGPDRMPRRCVSGPAAWDILTNCHKGPTEGHFGANLTARKVLESGFYWPTIFKDAHTLIKSCIPIVWLL